MKIIDDAAARVHFGNDRCGHYIQYTNSHEPPPGLRNFSCISLEDTRCAFCVLSQASCSSKQQQAKVSTAPTEEGGNDSPSPTTIGSTSATSDVVILKVEPGQTISSAPGSAHSIAPAIPVSVEAIPTARKGTLVTSIAISTTEAASKRILADASAGKKRLLSSS